MAYEIIAGRSKKDKEKYKLIGTILLGKHYVQMDKTLSLSNPIHLDVSGPHVVLVSGKRGSGKSYTLGVIAEGLANLPFEISSNLSCLIFDTLGIYWTMKYPNYRDDEILSKWDLVSTAMKPSIYVPFGLFNEYQDKGIPVDFPFALKPNEISAEDWCTIFKIDLVSEEGVLLERSIAIADEKYKDFDLSQLVSIIKTNKKVENKVKNLLENRFFAAEKWGLFKKDGTKITELFKGGSTTILDLSAYAQQEGGERIKALIIGLISKKILEQRMIARKSEEVKLISEGGFLLGESIATTEEKAPLVWIMIDEAHEFLPRQGETLASRPLIQLLREGRQPGISLVLATQQPGKIHTDVMTQSDIVISHRVTAKIDIDSLNLIAATYLPFQIQKYIDDLPATKGSAILIDDKLEKIYPFQVRPRFSWHGGADPSALKAELRALGISI